MLIVETISKIRRKYFVEGTSIKQLSLEMRLSRNTVRKVIRSGATEHKYHRNNQPAPRLGAYVKCLHELLEYDLSQPAKSRRTALRLYETLQGEGYQGAYDSVQRYVKKWREDRRHKSSAQVFIPLVFSPGEAYQFDWSHEHVILGGTAQIVKVAHFRLCHSRMFFVTAYPRESLEMVLDAHDRAFSYFGGTCRRGIYDNMSTAVTRILKGKDRDFNRRFARMCSHYLIEPVACTPAAGWEKGQVEKQVRDIRSWLFTPRPRFDNFEELNKWLARRCHELCSTRSHPEDRQRTIMDLFETEKSALLPIGAAFDGYSETECRVSSTSLVRYDRNHYSVDCSAVGKPVTIRATADRIRVIKNGAVIADHKRMFGRDKTVYNPWHYVSALERKPGALRNGAPFQDWELPYALQQVQQRLLCRTGGDREFVNILCASLRYGLDATVSACDKALSEGPVQGSIILNLLSREINPPAVEPATVPERLALSEEPAADPYRYNSLLREVTSVTR